MEFFENFQKIKSCKHWFKRQNNVNKSKNNFLDFDWPTEEKIRQKMGQNHHEEADEEDDDESVTMVTVRLLWM